MELTGLQRMVKLLEEWGLEVGTLVTDRHRQIAKWVADNMHSTRHCYDIWHIAKGRLNFKLKFSELNLL